MLRSRPAAKNDAADLLDDVRSSIDRGCFITLEQALFKKEVSCPGERRPFNVEKLLEQLLEARTLSVGKKTLFLSQTHVLGLLEKMSLSSTERKKLKARARGLREKRPTDVFNFLSVLYRRGVRPFLLFGIRIEGVTFHMSSEWCRTRHVFGLADAVHMSMFNLGVSVNFPEKVCLDAKLTDTFRKRIRCSINRDRYRVVVNRQTTKDRRYRLILHFLRTFPKHLLEKEYVKLIKYSLVDAFCVQAEQERPEPIGLDPIPLFPELTQKRLNSRFATDRKGRVRFYKNLLESKSLCADVGDDMIREAYEKHYASLCRPSEEVVKVPDEFIEKLYRYGQNVGKEIRRYYDPYTTTLPNSKACIEANRAQGGARSALKDILHVSQGPLYLSSTQGATRPEPFVVGLFGPPGSGKTTTVQDLVCMLGAHFFPEKKGVDLVYSRSCSTQHWDGYNGQPITVLDDFGQDLSDRHDLVEFEQLISVNRYILPMAELENKGQCFSSSIVIVTSNMPYGCVLMDNQNKPIVEEEMAVWRRFHFPLLLERLNGRLVFLPYDRSYPMRIMEKIWTMKHRGHVQYPTNYMEACRSQGHHSTLTYMPKENGVSEENSLTLSALFKELIEEFNSHIDFHFSNLTGSWRQVVSRVRLNVRQASLMPFYDVNVTRVKTATNPNDITISNIFPAYPPYHMPVVEAVAIPEPLKVRMITKAEAPTKCLQPLQRALFKYLKTKRQFCLTHGVKWGKMDETWEERREWIYRIESEIKTIRSRRQEGDLWLSGDYQSATDNFPPSVTKALIEGILSEIDHEPTRRWARYETDFHTIRYPNGVEGSQTSGQLMGSLLSFPLLCFLNDFIVSESGFQKGKYLINGDDVVAYGSEEAIRTWKRNCPRVGLDLSLGKNFIDPDFCTVNSQLFWQGQVQHTGKVSCQTRYGKTLSRCFSETQFYYGDRDEIRHEFIRRNLVELRKTPRSLDVPTTHGGLALAFSGRPGVDLKLAKEVYLHDFLKPFSKSFAVPGYPYLRALRVPVGIFDDVEFDLGGGEPESNLFMNLIQSLDTNPNESESGDLTHKDLSGSRRILQDHERLRNQLLELPLSSFPPLNTLRFTTKFIQKGKVGFVKERIIHLALRTLHCAIRGEDFDPDVSFEEVQGQIFDDLWCASFDERTLNPSTGSLNQLEEKQKEDERRYNLLLPGLEVKDPGGLYCMPCQPDLLDLDGAIFDDLDSSSSGSQEQHGSRGTETGTEDS